MRRAWAGIGVLAVALTLVGAQPAGARRAPSSPDGASARPGRSDERAVTLITGDRVMVSSDGASIRPLPATGRDQVRFLQRRVGDQTYVVPGDAVPMLARDALDWRLFDVTGLIAMGYDDARRGDLPLIVRTRGTAAVRSAHITRTMSRLDVMAVKAAKNTSFWNDIRLDPTAKIWLDGLRWPQLDRSAGHIGAPAAWDAGYTGAGVTVAVLDSGINTGHPDLADRVVDARDFSGEGPGDAVGHGTHVASIVAGTGAASAGRYRGIAHGASLLDGKVCGFTCAESAILAGMEWAAAEKGAAVVNLSLGGPEIPGIDPLEEAVNRLTAANGTLFVIAAGNTGGCSTRGRVASPAIAEAALTVGASDLEDRLATFSCQGPTIEDNRLKPDILGPGVGIVAARAPGTPVGDGDPVDEFYARSSGTSMAAPHVAGAAALLAQQHPDWRADRLKSALMGSALSNPTLTPYQQGAGRVDIARAITQTVTAAPASLGLGLQRWPHTDDAPVVRTLTYRNHGPAGATLTVRLDMTGPTGAAAPAGMFALSATTLTVPAGGEASLTVTANTRVAGPDGRYTGRLVATGGGGGVTVGTPIAIEREVESYDITIRALDRTGTPTDLFVGSVLLGQPIGFQGAGSLRLPRREYDVVAFVFTQPGPPEPELPFGSLSLFASHIRLTADVTLTFDARTARPVEVIPPRESARLVQGMIALNGNQDGLGYTFGLTAQGSYDGLFSAHIGASSTKTRMSSFVWGAWADPGPSGDFTTSPYVYNLSWWQFGRLFDGFFRRTRDRDLAVVRSDFATPVGGLITKMDAARPAGVKELTTIGVQLQFASPLVRTDYYTTEGLEWFTEVRRFGPFGFETLQGVTWRAYDRGVQEERWATGVIGPTVPRPLPAPWQDTVGARQFADTLFFRVPAFSGATRAHYGDVRTDTAQTSLYVNDQLATFSSDAGFVIYQAPSADARLRVEMAATQTVYDTSTEIRATWRLRTRAVTGPDPVFLPVMAVRFKPTLDGTNTAPGGRPYVIPVTVERQVEAPDSRVTSLTVDVSYDDGQTWRRMPLAKTSQGWLGTVVHPASGFVSLRAKAVDADGNSVEQTIIRAYRLR